VNRNLRLHMKCVDDTGELRNRDVHVGLNIVQQLTSELDVREVPAFITLQGIRRKERGRHRKGTTTTHGYVAIGRIGKDRLWARDSPRGPVKIDPGIDVGWA